MFIVKTYTVGTYSPGKLSVVYEISIQVLPTVPSPTTTHFIGRPEDIFENFFSGCLLPKQSGSRKFKKIRQIALFSHIWELELDFT